MARHAARAVLRARQRELSRSRPLAALGRLRADRDRRRRRAQRLRQQRFAGELQGRLHAERHGRVLPELHGARRGERRAAARLQQSAESAEQLSGAGRRGTSATSTGCRARSSAPTTTSCSRRSCSTTPTRTRCSPTTTPRTRRSLLNGRFQSFYDDEATAAASRSVRRSASRNTFGAAFHYRRDEHTRVQRQPADDIRRSRSIEPVQETLREHVVARSREHVRRHRQLDLVAGAEPRRERAEEGAGVQRDGSVLFDYPTGGSDATTCRARRIGATPTIASCAASISSRTRFPTIFERFSTRFGTALPNPDLEPERAVNYELGWVAQLTDDADLVDGGVLCGHRGHDPNGRRDRQPAADHADAERRRRRVLRRRARRSARSSAELWSVAANYTHLEREITDALQPGYRGVGRPTTRRSSRSPTSRRAAVDHAEPGARERPLERRHGRRLRAHRRLHAAEPASPVPRQRSLGVAVGGTNLLDENFELAQGYPEPGRNVYVRLRLTF